MTGGLKVPCDQRFNDVSQGYAILDSTSEMICETSLSIRTAGEYILKKTLTNEGFCYDLLVKVLLKNPFVSSLMYFSIAKRKHLTDSVIQWRSLKSKN